MTHGWTCFYRTTVGFALLLRQETDALKTQIFPQTKKCSRTDKPHHTFVHERLQTALTPRLIPDLPANPRPLILCDAFWPQTEPPAAVCRLLWRHLWRQRWGADGWGRVRVPGGTAWWCSQQMGQRTPPSTSAGAGRQNARAALHPTQTLAQHSLKPGEQW